MSRLFKRFKEQKRPYSHIALQNSKYKIQDTKRKCLAAFCCVHVICFHFSDGLVDADNNDVDDDDGVFSAAFAAQQTAFEYLTLMKING